MTEQRDYRSTVFLPKTDFPMKAGLPQKEPGILSRWQAEDIYRKTRDARSDREKFILHDGPPYANGDMHIGHALNHILKDMVVRTQTLLGKDAPYVPGWDCHGLPIEWKVEEEYRKKKKNKDEVPAEEFRAECRAYAQNWVNVQREQLKRLGINGDWDNPYLTMDFQAEATIVGELLKFAENQMLYRGAKPVMWSPVEKTALAEAEVEYEDILSTQIDVAFEITESAVPELVGAYAVIWTTTPWTIPVNQALGYGPEIEYHHYRAHDGRRFIVAVPLLEAFFARTGLGPVAENVEGDADFSEYALGTFKGSDLAGTFARHPMHALGGFFAEPRPFLSADFVTIDSGTGLVHEAPDHGEEDFELCKANGINPKFVVEADGKYREDWLWLAGQGSVINPKFNSPEGPVCTDLREVGALLAASADYKHSYPHSWRSKAKVIYRCTPQWFVPMDKAMTHLDGLAPILRQAQDERDEGAVSNPAQAELVEAPATLRNVALNAIAQTRFVPEKGRNRIGAMVEGRPDWVLSRQRAWGVPITLFVDRKTGEYLVDEAVNERIKAAILAKGVDAWSDEAAQDLLGPDYDAENYERVADILDVWFDSGSTHAFVLESGRWPDLLRPEGYVGPKADLYLEGSDQHRGWFQSSLLESCATRGHAPYKTVLTHGFTMDAKGFKMSKSLGNTISPLKVMETNGADIIRLWALSVDFTEDHRIGDEILKGVADQYRKLRNTLRYLLGALDGFGESERLPVAEMPELERYVLTLLGNLDATLRTAVDAFDFNTYVRSLLDFCNEDLSAFFFDIRKDCLYCDAPTDPKRRAYRTVLDTLFHALIRYAAPVIVFTAEETWQSRYPGESVHLLEWPEVPAAEADLDKWQALRTLRAAVTEAIEPLRREKIIGSSLAAEVTVPASAPDADLAELFITGTVTRGQAEGVSVTPSHDHKCGRCWRHLPEVTEDGDLCARCDDVVGAVEVQA
ncbi:isoleucine--tRNA ligase [Novosphingobium sp. P6W]|uniref:isoleucine--tRNA ligase n=1 Tax=Novosphingobium sp. P6W TaxID=1609758 RepID=UPI0005C2C19C|nr:isoleucine--tRNA ligase [Novosphingobium sp. P6W]AXB75228.1 isoleucine--tRNA ligase [Novosphingobium sp. P6W]KIS32717.1 isoleucine--tRNA ligase [Novosphingobium sp. P6W]